MSDLGHIRGDAPQKRAKSRGAEACHKHRNNSCANYAASVSPDELCRAALVSPAIRLCDPISVPHSMKP